VAPPPMINTSVERCLIEVTSGATWSSKFKVQS
jgi:hypothetical protein